MPPPPAAAPAIDVHAYLKAEEEKDLLRFVTCGSVDDGKSTLIGRLLHDSEAILDDQLADLAADSRTAGTQGGGLDLALLVDGLRAEREQGITIDVAYRFFSTDRRRFIIADTPGHEQYTRNTATGASTADLAVVLADARKGLLTQTRRHVFIASLLGIRGFVLAVNKMDLVGWDEDVFRNIARAYGDFARSLDLDDAVCIPISALAGDNVLQRSPETPWYEGPSLMEALETAEASTRPARRPFRMPVQWVNRPNPDFRGFSGAVAAGVVRPGDAVRAYPSERTATVARIVAHGGDLDAAAAGQAVTLVLDGEIDVSRGDVLAAAEDGPRVTDRFAAHLVWMGTEPLLPRRRYLMKIGAKTAAVQVTDLRYRIDMDTLEHAPADALDINEVGYCDFALDQAIAFDPYREVRETGGFILIDSFHNGTIAAGMIDSALNRTDNLRWQDLDVGKELRSRQKGQRPCVLWFTGLPGSGKSTAANAVERKLAALGRHSYLLDGDNVRHGINRDLGFTEADRVENIRRAAEIAKLFVDAGLIVLAAFISPFRHERQMARALVEEGEFVEIFVDAPLETCERRDPKGLYKRARASEIRNFTGIDSAYEPPEHPDIVLKTAVEPVEASAEQVLAYLEENGYL